MKHTTAEIVREYGPFGETSVNGVTFDGDKIWFASGDKLNAVDSQSGQITRSIDVAAQAGTAFDGKHLYQIAEGKIHKVDPSSGKILATIPAPTNGDNSGMAWAEGSLWIGEYRARKIHQVDPETGKVLRTIESNRFVTGVTWVDGEMWHATWENEQSELRHIDAQSGQVLESVEMPAGTFISGLESDGKDQFFCGGGKSGKIRALRRPPKKAA
jgi:glutamine cyclotransferase